MSNEFNSLSFENWLKMVDILQFIVLKTVTEKNWISSFTCISGYTIDIIRLLSIILPFLIYKPLR